MGEEERSSWFSIAAAAVAALLIVSCFAYLWVRGELRHLQVENSRVIPVRLSSEITRGISEIWFSPKGSLFATYQKGSILFVASWDIDKQEKVGQGIQMLDFSRSASRAEPDLLMNSFHGGISEDGTILPERALAYAISDDGATIAWAWKGNIFKGPLSKFHDIKGIRLGPEMPAVAISFKEPSIVTIVYEDNSLWSLDVTDRRVISSSPPSADAKPELIWGRGNSRIVSSSNSPFAYRLEITKERMDSKRFPAPSGLCFATNDHDNPLIGTEDGAIILLQPAGFGRLAVAKGRVRSLAPYNSTWAIAADGSNLLLIKEGRQATVLTSAPTGVRLLAVNRNRDHIAYASSHLLMVGELAWRVRLSERAKWLLALMLSVISFIAFLRVILIDVIKLIAARKAERAKGLAQSLSDNTNQ